MILCRNILQSLLRTQLLFATNHLTRRHVTGSDASGHRSTPAQLHPCARVHTTTCLSPARARIHHCARAHTAPPLRARAHHHVSKPCARKDPPLRARTHSSTPARACTPLHVLPLRACTWLHPCARTHTASPLRARSALKRHFHCIRHRNVTTRLSMLFWKETQKGQKCFLTKLGRVGISFESREPN